MKIFIDTANIEDIERYAVLVDGVTTNPSLIAKEGHDFRELVGIITRLVDGPISVEANSQKSEDIVKEAKEIAKISNNIVVKIPMTFEGLKATKVLNELGIKTNVTLIFSTNQALLAAKAGATYASIFIGRLDDLGQNGLDVVKDTVDIFSQFEYINTQVITASIRHPLHVTDAAKYGSHVATIPPKILDLMIKHNLTDIGLKKFTDDWVSFSESMG